MRRDPAPNLPQGGTDAHDLLWAERNRDDLGAADAFLVSWYPAGHPDWAPSLRNGWLARGSGPDLLETVESWALSRCKANALAGGALRQRIANDRAEADYRRAMEDVDRWASSSWSS